MRRRRRRIVRATDEHAGFPTLLSAAGSASRPHLPIPTSRAPRPRSCTFPRASRRSSLTPRTEWTVIADEAATPRAIYVGYVAPLAAIGAIALFAGQVLIGTPLPLLGVVRAGVGEGIVAAIFTFALALVSVWLLAQIIDALAPQFGGQRDSLRALKASAYSYTPAWLAGALHVVPAWGHPRAARGSLRALHPLRRSARAHALLRRNGPGPIPV